MLMTLLAGYNLAKRKTLEEASEKNEIPPEAKENNRKAINRSCFSTANFRRILSKFTFFSIS